MILVTGATGTIGRHVMRLLQQGGHRARAMTRARPTGADTVQADFDDPGSLRRAVAGAERVFLLTAPPTPAAAHDHALLAAAREAGVRSVVKVSAIGTGERFGTVTVGGWHAEAEEAVRAGGMGWTVLRPSSFASNCLPWAEAVRTGQPVADLTGNGEQGVIDPRDVAAVAVAALTDPDRHAGRTWTLTGPELLTVTDQARVLREVIGMPVATVDVAPDDARRRLAASGMPRAAVEAVVTGAAWARAGHNAVLTADVAEVLGRPPATFREWARRNREVFRRPGKAA
ncbi:NAD(P)H-binding protein [Actinoplanes sp. NPDC023714]|uniref:NAD(P)H-binding protein n=1 Tax=Actinoplanes sp. NPDC023714 TaxID=3154322 RepID=UPI0033DC3A63